MTSSGTTLSTHNDVAVMRDIFEYPVFVNFTTLICDGPDCSSARPSHLTHLTRCDRHRDGWSRLQTAAFTRTIPAWFDYSGKPASKWALWHLTKACFDSCWTCFSRRVFQLHGACRYQWDEWKRSYIWGYHGEYLLTKCVDKGEQRYSERAERKSCSAPVIFIPNLCSPILSIAWPCFLERNNGRSILDCSVQTA